VAWVWIIDGLDVILQLVGTIGWLGAARGRAWGWPLTNAYQVAFGVFQGLALHQLIGAAVYLIRAGLIVGVRVPKRTTGPLTMPIVGDLSRAFDAPPASHNAA
jgi:hypothetical protein